MGIYSGFGGSERGSCKPGTIASQYSDFAGTRRILIIEILTVIIITRFQSGDKVCTRIVAQDRCMGISTPSTTISPCFHCTRITVCGSSLFPAAVLLTVTLCLA
jgi:hypothetical protein